MREPQSFNSSYPLYTQPQQSKDTLDELRGFIPGTFGCHSQSGRYRGLYLGGCMRGKPLYVFSGSRLNIDGQEVVLIYTPFSHIPESERWHIEEILTRLRKKQPVILSYVKFDETIVRVIDPPEWKEVIESRALPGSIFDPHSVSKQLPIYEEDLSPETTV